MENNGKNFKLCYIDDNKAWFTNNFQKCWGDDFDDIPYEHNAGEPYDYWSELIEDNDDIFKRKFIHHPIQLKTLYFETNDWSESRPCDNYLNSPYSVEMINKGEIPWLITSNYAIMAGTTYEDFIKIVEENGGTIYLRREK